MHHAYIDKFAYQDSPIHRLDARVKFVVVFAFTVLVLSVSRTSPAILSCYAVGPFVLLVLGRVPLKFAFKHTLAVSPFVLILALTCPLYDRTPMVAAFGPITIETTVGWLRCVTIMGKFVVTMLALIALVSTTRFNVLLAGLQKLLMPKILVVQLGFLYRYIFVLVDRVQHMLRARAARKMRNLGFVVELRTAAAMVGALLLRSISNAENISRAMRARGFDGNWRTISRFEIGFADVVFAAAAAAFMIALQVLPGPAPH